jgi:hypothetical protein
VLTATVGQDRENRIVRRSLKIRDGAWAMVLLMKIRYERTYGEIIEDMILNASREWIRQEKGWVRDELKRIRHDLRGS